MLFGVSVVNLAVRAAGLPSALLALRDDRVGLAVAERLGGLPGRAVGLTARP